MSAEVVLKLSHDQALVLSDWLERMESSRAFAQVVDDRAVWSALHTISGTLDKSLVDIFSPDYVQRLEAARRRLLETLGDFDPMTDE
ncbi:hypothetical protein ONA91_18645 [Micromonospora sp. DR5-3]|uniref:hypothetical protein n=1 Tax=unclassified Micromonospora TaxID=2617518 RepID=UPI0011D64784|nr:MULTISPECIES: hypothetical protein [unclassified Micromonospora]MCW3816469.1 hypothetical protein [Micromonospora sp. DR5-3]TYC21240.1 hypothetical protein FXF52_27000 [Micromonospora sp. MP36]